MNAFYTTAADLAAGKKIPAEYDPSAHLIYSSPATLAYNSPGAIGFGVKRAALTIPESVMLLIAPASCGRNSTILSAEEHYRDRMFYLLMNETDLVTSRHLRKITQAVKEIDELCHPKVVILCITCVDALLATDLESICEKTAQETGLILVPSTMYALEREGRKPPMVQVHDTVFSLLKRKPVDPHAVNLLGWFSPIDPESDLFPLLQKAGLTKIRQAAEMKTLDAYQKMGEANFNLILDPEAAYAGEQLYQRLGMPYLEIPRVYAPDRIHHVYQLLAKAVGITIDDDEWYAKAKRKQAELPGGRRIVIGEMCNADPFELAAFLAEQGYVIPEIFSNVISRNLPTIKRLAKLSPETKVYTGISPSMINFQADAHPDLTIGKDAGQWYPNVPCVEWNSEKQPFGYDGFIKLADRIKEVSA